MTTGDTAPARARHIDALDGIRALAVLSVVIYHVRPDLVPGGWAGVDVFFVLSGWLITSILLREHRTTGRVGFGRFYARRALRLYPALILTVAFAVVIGTAGVVANPHLGQDVAAALGYFFDFRILWLHDLSPLSHTWSLGIEEQFYLVWPLLLAWSLRRHRERLGVAVLMGVAALVCVVTTAVAPRYVSFTPAGHAVELLIGAGFAIFAPRVPVWLAAVGVAPPIVMALTVHEGTPRWFYGGAIVLVGAGVAALIQCVATSPSPLGRALAWRPLTWLGQRSYGVYLYHFPLIYLVDAKLRHGVRQPAIVVGSVTLAALSYRFVEQPFLRAKRRFEPVVTSPPSSPAAPAAAGPPLSIPS